MRRIRLKHADSATAEGTKAGRQALRAACLAYLDFAVTQPAV
jgi:hypothetical protein